MPERWPQRFRVIDVSQPVSATTACFPGDVPFSKDVTVTYQDSQVINLCAFTMSPHVGTHADAPVHVRGDLRDNQETAATLALDAFVGPVTVVDVAPFCEGVTWEMIAPQLENRETFPQRILFRTAEAIRYDVFEKEYAWIDETLAETLGQRGVRLVGIDTHSVDAIDSKTLPTHHALLKYNVSWLENLDLTQVTPGDYFLSALPLKFTELEASPVRAVLLAAD